MIVVIVEKLIAIIVILNKMNTKQKAKEIFDYLNMQFVYAHTPNGFMIADKPKKEMLKEINFMLETD